MKRQASLGDLDLERHLDDPALRQSYVTPMFDLVAPKYDAFTRLFSFGMDQRWKRTLVATAREVIVHGGVVADPATGTGDIALALARGRTDLHVVATDVSMEMLARAVVRRDGANARSVEIAGGDLSALPFRSASIDAVTVGYGLRNTPDWRRSLAEVARVLKPGGHLLTLDFYQPSSAVWRGAFLGWLAVAGRGVGWWWHREPMAYGYIARSIAHYTTAEAFGDALAHEGFRVASVQRRIGGGIALHHAIRR